MTQKNDSLDKVVLLAHDMDFAPEFTPVHMHDGADPKAIALKKRDDRIKYAAVIMEQNALVGYTPEHITCMDKQYFKLAKFGRKNAKLNKTEKYLTQ